MNNREYGDLVSRGEFPADILVPLDAPFVNATGVIQNLLLSPITSVAIITSKAGSVRSNHWHHENWHYLFVISGSMEYYERSVDTSPEKANREPIVVKAGEMVFTRPYYVHRTVFLEDTVLISLGHGIKDHEHHEADLVREEF
jgi:oxalate decarboxylase/phosphoglucose isomerase-like protein (cupin superfamily)